MTRYLAGIAEDVARVPRPDRLQRRTRGFGRLGRPFPKSVVERAKRDAAAHAERINRIFTDFDVLVTPTTGKPPVGAAEWEGMSAMRTLLGNADAYPYTGIWNHTGQPSCSVPAPNVSDRGLPLGVQLIGPSGQRGDAALAGRPARGGRGLDRAPATARLTRRLGPRPDP